MKKLLIRIPVGAKREVLLNRIVEGSLTQSRGLVCSGMSTTNSKHRASFSRISENSCLRECGNFRSTLVKFERRDPVHQSSKPGQTHILDQLTYRCLFHCLDCSLDDGSRVTVSFPLTKRLLRAEISRHRQVQTQLWSEMSGNYTKCLLMRARDPLERRNDYDGASR